MSPSLEEKTLDQSILPALQHWHLLPNASIYGADTAANLYWQRLRNSEGLRIFKESSRFADREWVLLSHPLKWDSEFFGLKSYRLELIAPTSNHFAEDLKAEGDRFLKNALLQLKQDGLEWAAVQISPSDSISFQLLEDCGFRMVDTIVGYQMQLEDWREVKSEHLRSAGASDLPELESIARKSFGSRIYNVNRFNSDLKIPQAKVSELYAKWIISSVGGPLADEVILFEDSSGKALGFITLKIESQSNLPSIGVISLNAVAPEKHGQGIYSELLRGALNWFKKEAVDYVQIKTQIPNLAVHRAWQKIGASQFTCFHSFHFHTQEHG